MEGKDAKQMALGLKVLTGLVAAIFFLLSSRLWYLQIVRGEEYQRRSVSNSVRLLSVPAPRGLFLDRHGRPLVNNRLAYSVSVLPKELDAMSPSQRRQVLELLGRLLNIPGPRVEERVAQARQRQPYAPVVLASDLDARTLIQVEERRMDLPGVLIEEIPLRNYPYGPLAAHAFGYLGQMSQSDWERLKGRGYAPSDSIGQTGLERDYEQYLRGRDGGQQVEVDNLSRPVKVLGKVAPVPGANLILTLDGRVQQAAEQALDEQLKALRETGCPHAYAGAVVALDPNTGAILAMASRPAYDPNKFVRGVSAAYWNALSANPYHPFQNRVTQGTYAPGSTFKVVTLAAALEYGKTKPDELFFDGGRDPVYPQKTCWIYPQTGHGHGQQNLVQALQNSCNVVFYELGRRVTIDPLAEVARRLGLGQPTGLKLYPGESAGIIPDRAWKKSYYAKSAPDQQIWYPIETLDVSIGQGAVAVTPLQLANMYAAIANGGVLYTPYLVQAVQSPDGRILESFQPQVRRRFQWPKEVQTLLREGLRAVVTEGTAALPFRDFPIPVAGKTGTAEITSGGTEVNAVFAGFAPVDHPQIAVAVVIERGGHGGSSAAPVAKKVLEAFFGLDSQPPASQP
ncbi:MAG: penicillin-binding protein 2 [Firmicutes bacterium]|nr:penicillin-binding protein 2 [Bacillota bacterium]